MNSNAQLNSQTKFQCPSHWTGQHLTLMNRIANMSLLNPRDRNYGGPMRDGIDYVQLAAFLQSLDSKSIDCRERIAAMRKMMDQACDSRVITLSQWRALLERVSLVQSRCLDTNPDAWRHPPVLPRDGDQA